MGILEDTAFLFDLDGTLGEPKNIIPRTDREPTSPSLLCWELAVSEFISAHQIPVGFNRHGIWSPRHKHVGTDLERARSWVEANNIRKKLPREFNPEPELLQRMESQYQRLTDQWGPDFSIYNEVPIALQMIQNQGGRSFAWTGNTRGKTEIKIAPLLDKELIAREPMFTGEDPLKAGLILAAREILATDFNRMIIVGDTIVDQRAFEHMVDNLKGAKIKREDMVFARRIPSSSSAPIPQGLSLPKPHDDYQGGVFFELVDPLFNLLAIGPKTLAGWIADNNLNVDDIEAIDQELRVYNPFRPNSFNLEQIRPELRPLLSYVFSGTSARDRDHLPEATRFQYNSMFWDYIFSLTVGRGLSHDMAMECVRRQKQWGEMLQCQYLFERAQELIRQKRGWSVEV